MKKTAKTRALNNEGQIYGDEGVRLLLRVYVPVQKEWKDCRSQR